MAFKTAAKQAFKSAFVQASPVILEPIASLSVYVPDSYTGDIMGDLNKRRGRVLGMNPAEFGRTEIVADIPLAAALRLLHRPSFHDRRTGRFRLLLQPLRAGSVRCSGKGYRGK